MTNLLKDYQITLPTPYNIKLYDTIRHLNFVIKLKRLTANDGELTMFYRPYEMPLNATSLKPIKDYILNAEDLNMLITDNNFLKLCYNFLDNSKKAQGYSPSSSFYYLTIPEKDVYVILYKSTLYDVHRTSFILSCSLQTDLEGEAISLTPCKFQGNQDVINIDSDEITNIFLHKLLTQQCVQTDKAITDIIKIFNYINNEYPQTCQDIKDNNFISFYLTSCKLQIDMKIGFTTQVKGIGFWSTRNTCKPTNQEILTQRQSLRTAYLNRVTNNDSTNNEEIPSSETESGNKADSKNKKPTKGKRKSAVKRIDKNTKRVVESIDNQVITASFNDILQSDEGQLIGGNW